MSERVIQFNPEEVRREDIGMKVASIEAQVISLTGERMVYGQYVAELRERLHAAEAILHAIDSRLEQLGTEKIGYLAQLKPQKEIPNSQNSSISTQAITNPYQ